MKLANVPLQSGVYIAYLCETTPDFAEDPSMSPFPSYKSVLVITCVGGPMESAIATEPHYMLSGN